MKGVWKVLEIHGGHFSLSGWWRRTTKEEREHIGTITTQTPVMSPLAPVPPIILYACLYGNQWFLKSPPRHKHPTPTHACCTRTQTCVLFRTGRCFMLWLFFMCVANKSICLQGDNLMTHSGQQSSLTVLLIFVELYFLLFCVVNREDVFILDHLSLFYLAERCNVDLGCVHCKVSNGSLSLDL